MPFPQGSVPPTSPYHTYAEPAAGPQYGAPGAGGSAYGRERKRSSVGGYDALNRQFDDLDLNRERDYTGRERKLSRPRKYSTSAGDERPVPYGSPYASQGGAGPYGSPYVTPVTPGYAASGGKYSPNPSRPGELPYVPGAGNPAAYPGSAYSSSARGSADPTARPTTPYGSATGGQPQVYPRGHIMEGQPILPRSRASSPMPGPPGTSPYGTGQVSYPEPPGKARSHSRPPSPRLGGASPHIPGAVLPDATQQLPPPEGFSRPVNYNSAFSAFDKVKIQDMEEFLLAPQPPRMPLVLKSHDVYPEDWQRLMNVSLTCMAYILYADVYLFFRISGLHGVAVSPSQVIAAAVKYLAGQPWSQTLLTSGTHPSSSPEALKSSSTKAANVALVPKSAPSITTSPKTKIPNALNPNLRRKKMRASWKNIWLGMRMYMDAPKISILSLLRGGGGRRESKRRGRGGRRRRRGRLGLRRGRRSMLYMLPTCLLVVRFMLVECREGTRQLLPPRLMFLLPVDTGAMEGTELCLS